MGVGKTSLGRGLSKKLNLPHIDTDHEIEKKKNMQISNIFEFYGENYFRELEQDTIINILSKNKYSIISLGGGSFLNIKTREYIKKNSISIWINADIDVIYNRISGSKNIRPIVSKLKSKRELEVLLNKRNLTYKEADIKIEAGNLNKKSLINNAIHQIDKYLEKNNESH